MLLLPPCSDKVVAMVPNHIFPESSGIISTGHSRLKKAETKCIKIQQQVEVEFKAKVLLVVVRNFYFSREIFILPREEFSFFFRNNLSLILVHRS